MGETLSGSSVIVAERDGSFMLAEPRPASSVDEHPDRALATARDAIRDLVHAAAGHVGCRVCKAAIRRHAAVIVQAKRS